MNIHSIILEVSCHLVSVSFELFSTSFLLDNGLALAKITRAFLYTFKHPRILKSFFYICHVVLADFSDKF